MSESVSGPQAFLDELRRVHQRVGGPSARQLADLAKTEGVGGFLPRSTANDLLTKERRRKLKRDQVRAFVIALRAHVENAGGDPDDQVGSVASWMERLSGAARPDGGDPAPDTDQDAMDPEREIEPAPDGFSPPPRWRMSRRFVTALVIMVGCVVTVLVAVYVFWPGPQAYSLNVQTDLDLIRTGNAGVGGFYLVQRRPEALPAPPNGQNTCAGRYQWARKLHGTDANSTFFKFSLRAAPGSEVEINGARPVVEHSRAPSSGIVLGCPGEGQVEDVRYLNIDLDHEQYQFVAGKGQSPRPLDLRMSGGESETVYVSASAANCSCRWRLELSLLVNGKPKTVMLGDDDHPFVTEAAYRRTQYQYLTGRWRPVSGATPSGPPPPPPPSPTAGSARSSKSRVCDLLTSKEVAVLLSGAKAQPSGPTRSQGAATPQLQTEMCTYTTSASHDLLIVEVQQSPTGEDAAREFAAQRAHYAQQGGSAAVSGIWTEAYAFPGMLYARRGSRMLRVYVTHGQAQPTDEDGRRVVALSRQAAHRLWR